MSIDWDLVVKIAIPLATLALGRSIDQIFAKKPRLISYVGHVSAFVLQNVNRTNVFTHSIVVRNTGREAANNVRIGHHTLPADHQLFPAIPYTVNNVPGGAAEIVIPKLVPGEQITISYLYFPPLTWDRINSYTKSDEGFAKILNVIPTPQPPKWVVRIIWFLIFVGAAALIYAAVEILRLVFA
jgi:hypothetical protein